MESGNLCHDTPLICYHPAPHNGDSQSVKLIRVVVLSVKQNDGWERVVGSKERIDNNHVALNDILLTAKARIVYC